MPMVCRLHDLNEDVLYGILEQVAALRSTAYQHSVALKRLSGTCRHMRSYCMPLLFCSCQATAAHGVPPAAIRPYVRHIRYIRDFYSIDELSACGYFNAIPVMTFGYRDTSLHPPPFGVELDYLPALRSVTFSHCNGGVPWSALMKCMSHPTVTSISLGENAMWGCSPPPNAMEFPLGGYRLTHFSYTPWQLREIDHEKRSIDLLPTYAQELSYLRVLVLALSSTVKSLALPVETAPLVEMAGMDWPRLHTFSLVGRYTHPDQCHAITQLLPRMPNLRALSVQAGQCERVRRPPLLKTPPKARYQMHSLTVSYPDPKDPIFSCIGASLTSLSLRDSPRHYFKSRYSFPSLPAIYPILTASECLVILKRISAPRLTTLELVYEADSAEEELLQHLSSAFPLLQELELHRYRTSPDDEVPYVHIVEALTRIKYLRALYLNVDITDDIFNSWHAGCASRLERMRRRHERGRELVRLLQAGRCFEYLALPLHTLSAGTWVLYRPEWWRGAAVECDSPYAKDARAFYIQPFYRR